jgi:GTP-binding protein
MQRDEREYVLIDTAGVRKRGKITDVVEKFSVIKTLQAIEDANVVLLVIDAREGISDQDLSLLGFILNSGRSLVIVVNKWDGLSNEVREQVKETWTSVWALSTLRACTLSLRCTAAAWVTCSNPCVKPMTAPPVVRAPRC